MPEPLYGPTFGSYLPEDVAWLLTDISAVELEAPVEEREEAIQAGKAHYSESLPIEFQPSAEYYALYRAMVEEHAEALAHQVAVVGEKILAARGAGVVLVSLARAGVPIGILLKHYLKKTHGLEVPHYAVSIVRGKGLDKAAMAYLTEHHDPRDIMWVDGWTGKGAITKELEQAVAECNAAVGSAYSAELAVLADPGHAVELFGTREDYLIPSACLNSTVSGLISRTVANDSILKPGQFHGAKFYKHFEQADVSREFLAAVDKFLPAEPLQLTAEEAAPAEVTFEGWQMVEALCEEFGGRSVNLVKPGVGETTRVLLRRKPQLVLVEPKRKALLKHILMLCEERGIPVEEREGLVYSCVGLIEPKKGTGFDGKAALKQ